ncbi:MAG: putative PurR-regulated permease PerM [Phycisphaerales bacterium]|jgi:predicted PurR-regulated permease PerM
MPQDQKPTTDTPDPKLAPTPAWVKLHLWQMQPVRDVLLGLACLALFWMAQATSVVTVPLLLATLLAYLFEPVIQWAVKRLKVTRPGAVVGIIAGLALIVIVPATLAISYGSIQGVSFTANVIESNGKVNQALADARELPDPVEIVKPVAVPKPSQEPDAKPAPESPQQLDADSEPVQTNEPAGIAAAINAGIAAELASISSELELETGPIWVWFYDQRLNEEDSSVGSALDALNQFISSNSEDIAKTGAGVAVGTIERILGFALTLFSLAFMAFVTAFFFFFLATGWVEFQGFTDKLLPDKHRDRITDLAVKFDAVISGFIRGRITIAFIQSIVFSVGYLLIGVPAAFILGPIVAILSIVPYLALVGLPVAIGLMYLDGPGGFRGQWYWMLFAPTLFYFVGQMLDDYIWTPMIQGKSTGLDTPVILFASIAGGALFGVFGLLIAIPLAACAKILIQEIFWPRFKDWAEGRSADPLPIDEA